MTDDPVPTWLVVVDDGSASQDEPGSRRVERTIGLAGVTFRRVPYSDLARIRSAPLTAPTAGRGTTGVAAVAADLDGPTLVLAIDGWAALAAILVVVAVDDLDLDVPATDPTPVPVLGAA